MTTRDVLLKIFTGLRQEMKQRWNRYVPVGELLQDRWSRAKDYGFGQGSNIYDSACVVGDVAVGSQCWVGPNVYLDGTGGLTIGDNVTIGIGSIIFSHSTIERDMSAGAYPIQYKSTKIGNRVFLAPYSIIEMGADIGDHCVVMNHSVVKWPAPACSVLQGNPARIIGHVVVSEDRRPSIRFTREGMELMKTSRETFG